MRLFENKVESTYQKYLTVNTCTCSINYVSVEVRLRGVWNVAYFIRLSLRKS